MWKWLKPILILVLCAVFGLSTIKILLYIKDGNKNSQLHEDIKQIVYNENTDEKDIYKDDAIMDNSSNDTEAIEYTQHKKIFNNLASINKDAVGWVSILNTDIDYPVLQGEDNDYYLSHNIKKEQSVRGSIFMDWQNRENDSHIILYGHNMKDGSMFGNMKLFEDEKYYDGRSIIEFNMYGESTRWEIFSVTFADNKPLRVLFEDDTDFLKYIENMKENSLYDTEVDVNKSDRILTLSTCSKQFHDARLVLHAKMIE